jgi:hypothetical protein
MKRVDPNQMSLNILPREVHIARAEGARYYFTGRPCRHGHIAKRATKTGNCMECKALIVAKWKKKNRSKLRVQIQERRHIDRERYRKECRDQAKMFRQRRPEYFKEKYESNPEFRAKRMSYSRHREIKRAKTTPPWLTKAHWRAIGHFIWRPGA